MTPEERERSIKDRIRGGVDLSRIEFHAVVIEPGWVEYRIVVPVTMDLARPSDMHEHGEPARMSLIKWWLSSAAGLAEGSGLQYLADALHGFWKHVLGVEHPGLTEKEPHDVD